MLPIITRILILKKIILIIIRILILKKIILKRKIIKIQMKTSKTMEYWTKYSREKRFQYPYLQL